MHKSATVYAGLFFAALWSIAAVSKASTITVSPGATTGSDNGCSLTDAVNAANTGGAVGACTLTGTPGGGGDGYSHGNVIELAAGNYTFNTADNDQQGGDALPVITGDVIVAGDPGGSVITRAGGAAFRFFFVGGGASLELVNLTVRNGQIQAGGGGDDPARPGPPGGDSGPAEGGAIYNQGSLTLNGVTLTRNDAVGDGGGAAGGAVFNDGGNMSVLNSTLANNAALDSDGGVGNGGALFNQSGTVTVRFATFAGNRANAGGAVYNAGAMNVNSSILSGSTDGGGTAVSDCESSGAFTSGFDVVQQPGSCPFNNNDQTADPRLATAAPANNGGPTPTIALDSDSPAIDHGDIATAPATDQRGDPRDSQPDVGSYEFLHAPTISGLHDVTVTEGDSVPPVAFTLTGAAPLTVTATSSNTALLPASGLTVSSGCGNDTGHYNCTLTLAPAANQTGTSTVTVKVADGNGGHDQQSMSFTVQAPTAPAIALSPGTLNFGSIAVGTTAMHTETIKNTGIATLSIGSIQVAGGGGVFQIAANNCGTSLGAGASCAVAVRFAPADATSYTAALSVSSNAASGSGQAALTGTGTAAAGGGAPAVSLSPASIDYGSVTVGRTLTRTETLTNTGDGTLSITGLEIEGTGADVFHITEKTCHNSLAAGANCEIKVAFAPTAAASYSATLQITSNAPSSPDQAALSGSGTVATTPAPIVSLSTGSLDFGSVAVGSTATRTETLTNTGNASLSIDNIAVTDGGDNFQVAANNCGSSVNPGKSCTIEVAFAPAATTTYTGTLTISSNASSSPDDVGLAGTGTTSGGGGGGPPTAIAASYTLSANHAFSGQLQGSATNGATLSYAVVAQPAHGQLKADPATGAFVYTPAHNFIGSDGFSFDVSDGTSTSAPATISLTIVRGDLAVKNGGGGALGFWALAMLGMIAAAVRRRRNRAGRAGVAVLLALAVTVCGACFIPAPARAADPGGWYAGLQLNLIKPDNGRVASTSGFSGRTLTGGRYFGDHFALEIQRGYHSDHPRSLFGIANWVTWGVNALWFPRMSSDTIAPFVLLGAGHQYEYRGDGSEPTTSFVNFGFGFTRQIGITPWRIRVDVQSQHAFSGGFNDFVGSLGVTYAF